MPTNSPTPSYSEADLVLERVVDVPCDKVWAAWTQPAVECDIDLRPGGVFRTVMMGPQGERFDNLGCYLEVVPQRRLVWTTALGPGFRPLPDPPAPPKFSCILSFEPAGPSGTHTRYTAAALHRDAAAAKVHGDMGFHDGWGTALAQLVACIKAGR
jgi:uncharacterized protein YndB with AHSA1/START domain